MFVTVAYAAATAAAVLTVAWLGHDQPLVTALAADVVATVVVFGFSHVYGNASVYDPYWSVAPPLLGGYWAWVGDAGPRALLVLALVTAWAVRLTYNWARRWTGRDDEDWRYREIRARTGRLYPAANLLGIQLFPTLLVFAACLPLYALLVAPSRPLGALDALAFAVTAGAIAIESIADQQLRAFLDRGPARGELLSTGLWAWSRHPNYFGEVLFWWGVYLFAVAGGAAPLWTLAGPVAITALFAGVSIPLMDRRSRERRPGFAAYCELTSPLVPWPPRRAR